MSQTPYNDTNRGVVFENAEKRSEKSPDYDGEGFVSATLAGRVIELAGWIRPGRNKRLISLVFREPYNGSKPPKLDLSRGRLEPVHEKRSEKAPDFEGAIHVPAELAEAKFRIACWFNEKGGLDLRVDPPRPPKAAD